MPQSEWRATGLAAIGRLEFGMLLVLVQKPFAGRVNDYYTVLITAYHGRFHDLF
jgi:hypothetical protein